MTEVSRLPKNSEFFLMLANAKMRAENYPRRKRTYVDCAANATNTRKMKKAHENARRIADKTSDWCCATTASAIFQIFGL